MRTLAQLIEAAEIEGHAVCSPSKAAQWMACPASIRQIEMAKTKYKVKDEGNAAAADGTIKHEWLEKLFEESNIDVPEEHEAVLEAYYMIKGCLGRASYGEAETRLSIFPPLNYGTADYIAIDFETMTIWIFDAKFGRIEVSPNALQLKNYAIGLVDWCIERDISWDTVQQVKLAIAQPFVSSEIQVHSMSKAELKMFAVDVNNALKKVEEAYIHSNMLPVPGDKQCQWCLAKNHCKEYEEWLVGIPHEMEQPTAEALAEIGIEVPPEPEPGAALADAYAYWLSIKKWGEVVEDLFKKQLAENDGEPIGNYCLKKLRSGAAKWRNDDPEFISGELGCNVLDLMKLDSPSAIAKRLKLDLSELIIEGEPVMGIKEV